MGGFSKQEFNRDASVQHPQNLKAAPYSGSTSKARHVDIVRDLPGFVLGTVPTQQQSIIQLTLLMEEISHHLKSLKS